MNRLLFTAMGLGLGLLAAQATPGLAQTPVAAGLGIGVDSPFQDDAEAGPMFGLRARIGGPAFVFEPSFNWFGGGDYTDITSLALNGIARGRLVPWIYWTGGIGWSWVDLEGGTDSPGAITYNVGAGVELPLGPVSLEASPRFFLINTPGEGHREHMLVMFGASYTIR